MDFKALRMLRLYSPEVLTKTTRIMRLTAIFLLAACLQISARGLGQNLTLHLKDASLQQVFHEIERQSGYSFVYGKEQLLQTRPVNLTIHDANLVTVLNLVFADQPLDYTITGNYIAIKQKIPVPASQPADSALPRLIDIHGRVVDDKGQPVPGVTVSVRGGPQATATDDNGEFTLKTVGSDAVLVFTSSNMEKLELKIKGQKEFFIRLKPKTEQLGEVSVEVNTGYQKIPKERATGSFTFIDNKLFNRAVGSNVVSRLEGVTSGLLFNRSTSNFSESNPNISIQGYSTLFSNDQPLIVVDNFAYDGSLNNLNPNDIESVTILKDAAASSIWGVRSGNGVVVITTKHGKRNQKINVEFNANTTIGQKPNLYYGHNFLDASDYIDITTNLFDSGYYKNTLTQPYALVSTVVEILAKQKAGTISSADATSQINALRTQDVRTDLTKYFYQQSVAQQYAINLSGGGNNSSFFTSIGYDNSLSNNIGNKNHRITLNSVYNIDPAKDLHVTMGMNYLQTNTASNGISNALAVDPYTKLADANGNPLPVPTDYRASYKDSLTSLGFLNWQFKPLAEVGLADNTSTQIDNRIDISAKKTFIWGGSVEANYQYERSSTNVNNYYSDSTYTARNLINKYTEYKNGNFSYPIPIGGILQSSNGYLTSDQARLQFNYGHLWENKHDLEGIAGSEIRQAINESNSNVAYGYDKSIGSVNANIDYADYFPLKATGIGRIPNSTGFGKITNNFISYFSNISYSYKGTYIFSLSGRIDHSNLFGVSTNQKAAPLYSSGLAYIVNKESFYHVTWLPYLKLRATFGYSGNINTSAAAVTTIKQQSGSQFNNLEYASINNPGNPELAWEKIRKLNFGLDYAITGNTLSGSFDYYFKKGLNLFGTSPLPASTGLSNFFGNTANTSGRGFDFVLRSNNITTRSFKWTSNLLVSYALDKVTKYDVKTTPNIYFGYGSNSATSLSPIVGAPIFALYSYKWAGLSHDKGDPQGYVNGKPSTDYNTILGSNSFDSLQYSGPSRPTIFGSFMNTFAYKRFELSFNIIFKFDYYFKRQSISSASGIGFGVGAGPGSSDYPSRWQRPGDEVHTNVPSLQYPPFNGNRQEFYTYSAALVDRGDNIRLKDVEFTYNLEKQDWNKNPFQHLQLYIYTNNLGILWRANKDKIDPDVYTGDIFSFPSPRTISIGIKANF